MDENQIDAKDILRKRILDEKLETAQSDDTDQLMSESGSVFQTFSGNSMSEGTSLFHSREDSHPDFDVKESSENFLFSSASTPLSPDELFPAIHEEETESNSEADDAYISGHTPLVSEISSVPDFPEQISTDNAAGDSPVPDEEDLSDSAFPLFLSFKANDSIQNVSEGVREKYSDHLEYDKNNTSDPNSITSSQETQAFPDNHESRVGNSSVHSVVDYSDSGIPIFKPYTLPEEKDEPAFKNPKSPFSEEPTYDIPNVFSKKQRTRFSQADAEHVSQVSDTKSRPERSSSAADLLAEGTFEKSSTPSATYVSGESSSVSPTVRPGARYSPAQQMGNAAPLSPREIKGKKGKKSHEYRPFLILVLIIAILIAVFSLWSSLDSSNLFSGLFRSQSEATDSGSVAATSISSDTTIAATSAESTTTETTINVTSAPTTTATTVETTAIETTAEETTTAASTTVETTAAATESIAPAKIPSGFSTSIADGKSNEDTASFSILFKNSGAHDVSLYDGVEYITIAFSTNNIKITQVTSPDFTFTPDPKKTNFFIGTPVSTDIIAKKDTKTVVISAKSDRAVIGMYTIKYFVNCYK